MLRDDDDVVSIGGLELGAVPIVAAVCACSVRHRPILGFVVRKERKGHGTDNRIDGNFRPNTTVALCEDVTTTGGSVMQAVRAVREQGATVKKIITIVDRLEGATDSLAREGIALEFDSHHQGPSRLRPCSRRRRVPSPRARAYLCRLR